jgi:hypothetical protein
MRGCAWGGVLHGKLPGKGRKADPIEMYNHGRYFTVTGVAANGCPATVNERQVLLIAFCEIVEKLDRDSKEKAKAQKAKTSDVTPVTPFMQQAPGEAVALHDDEIIDLASKAKNSAKFKRLWAGDTSGHDGDDSEADSALCCMLAFYSSDAGQIDRLFRQGGLMRPKWEREDYRTNTINNALALVTEKYKPRKKRKSKPAIYQFESAREYDAAPSESSGVDESEPDFITNGVKVEKQLLAYPMARIISEIRRITGDWPRRAAGALFVPGDCNVSWLESTAATFGYLATKTGTIKWHKGISCCTKEETCAELYRTATTYEAVEVLPHSPPMAGHFYACTSPTPGNGSTLDTLIKRFCPATPIDGDLILAAFVTCFWGGPGGARPAFCITSDAGRGSGKSKLLAMIGYLAGGQIELSANETAETIKQRLLSPEGLSKRVAALDNIKSMSSHGRNWNRSSPRRSFPARGCLSARAPA